MTLSPSRGDNAPGHLLYLTDSARAAMDLSLLAYAVPLLPLVPRGDKHPVLVLPRLHGSDASTALMRGFLRLLGYRTYGWQLGRNIGPTSEAVHGMRARLEELANRYEQPVTLIGWSLGGIYARQLARRVPAAVRQVITVASPIRLARFEQSRASDLFHRYADQHIEQLILPLEHDEEELPVPATSIYSPMDGIVAWRTCLDVPAPRAENIAVCASHLGIPNHPATLWAIADRLAQPCDQWARFQPPSILRAAYLRQEH